MIAQMSPDVTQCPLGQDCSSRDLDWVNRDKDSAWERVQAPARGLHRASGGLPGAAPSEMSPTMCWTLPVCTGAEAGRRASGER